MFLVSLRHRFFVIKQEEEEDFLFSLSSVRDHTCRKTIGHAMPHSLSFCKTRFAMFCSLLCFSIFPHITLQTSEKNRF